MCQTLVGIYGFCICKTDNCRGGWPMIWWMCFNCINSDQTGWNRFAWSSAIPTLAHFKSMNLPLYKLGMHLFMQHAFIRRLHTCSILSLIKTYLFYCVFCWIFVPYTAAILCYFFLSFRSFSFVSLGFHRSINDCSWFAGRCHKIIILMAHHLNGNEWRKKKTLEQRSIHL